MGRLKALLGLSVVFVIAVFLGIHMSRPAQALSTYDQDYIAIKQTLRTYADIEDEGIYTLDDSRLSEVLANDPRGGSVDPELEKSVRIMTGRLNLKAEDIGFLDVVRAKFAYYRKVKQLYEDAIASGVVKLPTPTPYDPSNNPVSLDIRGTDKDPNMHSRPDPRIVPEVRELEEATGLVAGLPVSRPETITRTDFNILSISIDGDIAHTKIDWYYGIYDDIFIKRDGRWYLAGHHLIEWKGGG